MNAAVVHAFDAPPRYTTFADPVAGDGDVIVKVAAAGLHPIVRALANGTHYGSSGELSFIPGVDGAGRLEDGTRVYFGTTKPRYGTFAEKAAAAKWMCIPLPDGLDEVTAAGIANPGMSSWAALKARAKFTAGESVLILGATGIAGKLSVQIAKRLGARRVIAAGRNPQSLDALKALGADAVISLTQERDALVSAFRTEIAENGVDVVLDYLWGQPAEAVLAAIAQKGLKHATSRIRFIQVGNTAAPTISLPAATLRSSGIELLGSGFGSASMDEILQAVREFFQVAAKTPFQASIKTIALRDVESVWNNPERDARIVFQP
ncbi:zinc-binding alcohol dehydrogenase family protein [Alloacidobacterium dinghuense]|uniref:Zinc-binding alcohol dehydrogenase family protein n=1 Tax=Alloacidobacterium dinghuense TaxID=2763107 RepID=A0A7G8BCN0_9BACT|nr:zinc-binding alcohol dehydrogenase family protein [Alloacidobacterium dinghuense]QNI30300.1 zinc-binding alcohol dehydrogenase family protein [Alloacidobacterium dinghuense]